MRKKSKIVARIATDNPDLPISFIRKTLSGLNEVKLGKTSPFTFLRPKMHFIEKKSIQAENNLV